jgi:hypothetical protein
MTKRPTTLKLKPKAEILRLAQEPYVASGGYGATEYGTDTHGVAGAGFKMLKSAAEVRLQRRTTTSPEPAGGAVFGGKSRKNKV